MIRLIISFIVTAALFAITYLFGLVAHRWCGSDHLPANPFVVFVMGLLVDLVILMFLIAWGMVYDIVLADEESLKDDVLNEVDEVIEKGDF